MSCSLTDDTKTLRDVLVHSPFSHNFVNSFLVLRCTLEVYRTTSSKITTVLFYMYSYLNTHVHNSVEFLQPELYHCQRLDRTTFIELVKLKRSYSSIRSSLTVGEMHNSQKSSSEVSRSKERGGISIFTEKWNVVKLYILYPILFCHCSPSLVFIHTALLFDTHVVHIFRLSGKTFYSCLW